MNFYLSQRSLKKMKGVHPDLVEVVRHAIDIVEVDFGVLEGLRSTKRQQELFQQKASLLDGVTKKSRHQTGHAVDLVAYIGNEVRWDWPLYHKISKAMKTAAKELNVPLEWGGDWKRFPDGPHFQLPRKDYKT